MLSAERVLFQKTLSNVAQGVPFKQEIIRYFPETHMRYGHSGLTNIAKNHGVSVNKLQPGEYLMFVNKKQNALKMLTAGNVLCHLKMPGNERIDPRTITMLPKFFNGTEINYNAALSLAVKKYFKRSKVSIQSVNQ